MWKDAGRPLGNGRQPVAAQTLDESRRNVAVSLQLGRRGGKLPVLGWDFQLVSGRMPILRHRPNWELRRGILFHVERSWLPGFMVSEALSHVPRGTIQSRFAFPCLWALCPLLAVSRWLLVSGVHS